MIRAQALVGLRAREDVSESVRARIIALGRDPDETVRSEAILSIEALYREDDNASFQMLQHIAMSDGSKSIRKAARRALDGIIGSALAELRKAMDDAPRRERIAQGLELWDEEYGWELLDSAEREIEGGSRDDWVDDALVLQRFGNRGVAAALRILGEALESSPDPEDRVRAAQALGDLGAQARPLLEVLAEVAADDWQPDEVRQAAQEATTHIAPE